MDEFKDFFKDLRDRITSPLFGSFIVSWLISNWNLVFIVLFNNADTLKKDRYAVIYNEFSDQSLWRVLGIPAAGTVFYLFAYPLIKNYIKLYHAKKDAENAGQILHETSGHPISLTNYVQQLQALENEKKTLTDQIGEQIQIRNERNVAITEVTKLKQDLISSQTELADVNNKLATILSYSHDLMNGSWKVSITQMNGTVITQIWQFELNSLIVDDTTHYIIQDFVVNPNKTVIAFKIKPIELPEINTANIILSGRFPMLFGTNYGLTREIAFEKLIANEPI